MLYVQGAYLWPPGVYGGVRVDKTSRQRCIPAPAHEAETKFFNQNTNSREAMMRFQLREYQHNKDDSEQREQNYMHNAPLLWKKAITTYNKQITSVNQAFLV